MRIVPLVFLLCSVGCSLAPDTVPQPRWFRAPLPVLETVEPAPGAPEMRFTTVEVAQHLRERMTWRRDGVEYGYYDLNRWTEDPEEVATFAVHAAVFASGRVRRSLRNNVPTLHVLLRSFEQVIDDSGDYIEVELIAVIEDSQGDLAFQKSYSGTAPVDGDPVMMARELGNVTGHLVQELAHDVAQAARALPEPSE